MRLDVYRRVIAAALLGTICLAAPAVAGEEAELSGSPVVQNNGVLVLGGREIALWGITMLDPDQQCWHDGSAWPCGEHAIMALKHFIEGQLVKCRVKSGAGSGKLSAQCFRQKGPLEQDVAHYLVSHGWAMDQDEDSDGLYEPEQEHARQKRFGIWASQFQTPEDWREGVQRFMDSDDEANPGQEKGLCVKPKANPKPPADEEE